jgi:putative pyruvate formate lyase activating enzyme
MPGQQEEASAIFRWLADNLSSDTYVNIMGQYRPEYQVRGLGVNSRPEKYSDIDRQPYQAELNAAYKAARAAGLWRFDQRCRATQ